MDGVALGENVIRLDFTSPILPSGSAITRYVDKEDGAEYIYSLFVPSDASTAFPVFDQPDLKARFELSVAAPREWNIVSNVHIREENKDCFQDIPAGAKADCGPTQQVRFHATKPISTYVFAFAAGPFERVEAPGTLAEPPAVAGGLTQPPTTADSGGKPAFRTDSDDGDVVKAAASNNRRKPPATAGGTAVYTSGNRRRQSSSLTPLRCFG